MTFKFSLGIYSQRVNKSILPRLRGLVILNDPRHRAERTKPGQTKKPDAGTGHKKNQNSQAGVDDRWTTATARPGIHSRKKQPFWTGLNKNRGMEADYERETSSPLHARGVRDCNPQFLALNQNLGQWPRTNTHARTHACMHARSSKCCL